MDYEYSETQIMLRDVARDLLTSKCSTKFIREVIKSEAGCSEDIWQEMAKLGWLALIIPPSYGGEGCTLLDLRVLVEEMGRASLPSPLLDTMGGAFFIIEAGTDTQKQEFLRSISQGNEIIALGLNRISLDIPAASPTLVAEQTENGYVIQGTESPISYANIADHILCLCKTGENTGDMSLFLADGKAKGLEITPLYSIGRRQFQANFNNVRVSQNSLLGGLNNAGIMLNRILPKLVALKCAELAGGAQQVLEITVDYSKSRLVSKRPIGSFQAIQHHCANMFVWVEGARHLSYQALKLLDAGSPCLTEVAIAKAFLNKFYWKICLLGHQINGAIAFCEDHILGLYTQEAKLSQQLFGKQEAYLKIISSDLLSQKQHMP